MRAVERSLAVEASLHEEADLDARSTTATAAKNACGIQLHRDHGRNSISTPVVFGGSTTPR
jgi:hypothetical protein